MIFYIINQANDSKFEQYFTIILLKQTLHYGQYKESISTFVLFKFILSGLKYKQINLAEI